MVVALSFRGFRVLLIYYLNFYEGLSLKESKKITNKTAVTAVTIRIVCVVNAFVGGKFEVNAGVGADIVFDIGVGFTVGFVVGMYVGVNVAVTEGIGVGVGLRVGM